MDFITEFLETTASALSPERYRLWSGISLLAAACERRLWLRSNQLITFPNLYVFLVGAPGVGKQIIDNVRELAAGLSQRGLKVSPNSMTKASLVDELVKAKGSFILSSGVLEYHSLFIVQEEAAVLMPTYDGEFLGMLNSVYNNPTVPYSESRRASPVKSAVIPFPQINLLMGVQPGWMAGTFPELAWATGLMSRVIMVYVEELEYFDIFADSSSSEASLGRLKKALEKILSDYGEFTWTPEAEEQVKAWRVGGEEPRPSHSKLAAYCNRRTQHLLKLCLLSCISRGEGRKILPIDLTRAQRWLFDAENYMPDIFRAMSGANDQAIIEELHIYASNMWKMNKGKPIHERALFNFLTRYVKAERVEKLLQIAERSNVIARLAGTETYVPRAKHEHGME